MIDSPISSAPSSVVHQRRLASLVRRRIHLAKTLTWRVVGTATTVAISYLLIGNLAVGAAIGGIEAIAKTALYYAHERAWAKLAA